MIELLADLVNPGSVALGGGWPMVVGAANVLISGGIGVAVYSINARTRKIDHLEKQLREMAGDAVELRFAQVGGEMSAAVGQLRAVIAEMQRRLERGDAHFKEQGEAWRKLELKSQAQISEIREKHATKDELRRIEEQLNVLQQRFAAFGNH